MKLIHTNKHLLKNLEKVEFYLSEGTDYENEETIKLIQRGKCFVAYQINDELRFAPSRFVGYVENTIQKHKSEITDGRKTNRVINKIIGAKFAPNKKLEKKYKKYISELGIKEHNNIRKFWSFKLTKDFKANRNTDEGFPEGKIVERKHKARERNSKVVRIAKENFILNNKGKLFCQVCGFDFQEKYGDIGIGFIEGHHTIPVSEMKQNHKTKPEDIALLCANCHRMVHKKRPWLKMEDLKRILR